jgi:quinolinate synthase
VPDKEIVMIKGGCPVHGAMTPEAVEKAKAAHPEAKFLVHPECVPAVVSQADYAGSTTGIMDYAAKSDAKEFIIGTENSIVQHLQLAHPDKMFYPLSKYCVCHDMKLTTLTDVLNVIKGTAGEEITMSEDMRLKAKHCMDRMLELGK